MNFKVGNKCDSPNKVVSFNDQQEYAKLINLKFFETSAKENINVDEVKIFLLFFGTLKIFC
jgi:hypothetical protein